MFTKTAVAALITGSVMFGAEPKTPYFFPDAQAIDANDIRLNMNVFAMPGMVFRVWFEDSYGLGDRDYNDLAIDIRVGTNGIVTTGYYGATSTDLVVATVNGHKIGEPFFVQLGTKITVMLLNQSSGYTFIAGPDYQFNPDYQNHAIVEVVEIPAPRVRS